MLEFEWNADKAASNIAKHGVSFEEAATVFGDPLSLTVYDPDHSQDEDRYITMGTSVDNRLILVSHTDREDLVQKAVGWMLREAGRTDPARLERFLRANGSRTPRTTLRYAIERFPEATRLALLEATRATPRGGIGAPHGRATPGR